MSDTNNDQRTQRIAELKEKAEAATPGPWTYTGPEYGDGGGSFHNVESPAEGILGEFGPSEENARYIAAADPQATLSLIGHIAELERQNAEFLEAVANLIKVKGRFHTEHAYQRLVAVHDAATNQGGQQK